MMGKIIYFIQQGKDGPIKIGITDDLKSRVSSLQTANPYKLHLLYSEKLQPGLAEKEEAHLHWVFKGIRLRGEWFRPMPFLIKRIAQMKKEGFYSIPEFNWDYEKQCLHNTVWAEIGDFWNGFVSVARKYKLDGDIESVKFIKHEISDLLGSI